MELAVDVWSFYGAGLNRLPHASLLGLASDAAALTEGFYRRSCITRSEICCDTTSLRAATQLYRQLPAPSRDYRRASVACGARPRDAGAEHSVTEFASPTTHFTASPSCSWFLFGGSMGSYGES